MQLTDGVPGRSREGRMHLPRNGEVDRVLRAAFEGEAGCGARSATAEHQSDSRECGTPVAGRGVLRSDVVRPGPAWSGPQDGGRYGDPAASPTSDHRTGGPPDDLVEGPGSGGSRTSGPVHFGAGALRGRVGSLPLEPERAPLKQPWTGSPGSVRADGLRGRCSACVSGGLPTPGPTHGLGESPDVSRETMNEAGNW